MTTVLGPGIDRVDGPVKVRGAAAYPTDVTYPDLAHAALVRSTIASGRVTEIDDAGRSRGKQESSPSSPTRRAHSSRPPRSGCWASLRRRRCRTTASNHHGQYVAVVVAATPHEAAAAARLVKVDYEPGDPLLMDFDDPRSELEATPWNTDTQRGDVEAGLAEAEVIHEATYTTAANTNNPLGLFATVCRMAGRQPSRCTTRRSGLRTRRRRSPA